jgi:hypothetical protein
LVDELCDFIIASGIHVYSNKQDVVYAGNGYIALHAASGGKKAINLPSAARVISVFGAKISEEVTDILEFELKENETALFKIT